MGIYKIKQDLILLHYGMGFPGGSAGKESACNSGDLGWEDPLEKGMATHSNILACSPWGCKSWTQPSDFHFTSLHILLAKVSFHSSPEESVTQSCPALFNAMDCSLSDYSVHRITQARY